MVKAKENKGGTRRKRDDMMSASSTDSFSSTRIPEAKRFNEESMAEVEVAKQKTKQETVVRIETNTNQIIADHKILQENYEVLKSSLELAQSRLEDVRKENDKLKSNLIKVTENYNALHQKVKTLEDKAESSDKKITSQENDFSELLTMHDDLKQYTRKFNLEIYGIPEEREEDTEQLILDLAKCIHIELYPEDIDICHRMSKGFYRSEA